MHNDLISDLDLFHIPEAILMPELPNLIKKNVAVNAAFDISSRIL